MHGSAHRASRLSRFMPYWQGKTYTFDSFECAIHKLAPICAHCSVRIIGHGMEKSDRMFCCDHCAEQAGVKELRDRA